MCVVFFVLYFSKKTNHLITGKKKLEEQWLEVGLFFVLYGLCCLLPYCIYSLDSELTLTMQHIYVAQETTAQLRADKKELKKNYSKKLNRNKSVLTQNVLEIDKTENEGAK